MRNYKLAPLKSTSHKEVKMKRRAFTAGLFLIVFCICETLAKVEMLKRLQSETAAELNALLSSILDKAFKGEL
jgi:hypothetical protein